MCVGTELGIWGALRGSQIKVVPAESAADGRNIATLPARRAVTNYFALGTSLCSKDALKTKLSTLFLNQ